MLLALLLSASPSLPVEAPRKIRVFVDAGHGAPGNVGALGCHCQQEQAHTLSTAHALATALTATGRFEVLESRLTANGPRYQQRIARAKAWKADVIISLHSDVRGEALPVNQGDGGVCWQNTGAAGFTVLWSDEGPALASRQRLGRAVGQRMREAGFVAYGGDDYVGLYRQDDVEPSGFIDVRPMKQRVYFLRASTIPTVIVETHHALNPEEVARWNAPETHAAFAAAISAAVFDFARPAP